MEDSSSFIYLYTLVCIFLLIFFIHVYLFFNKISSKSLLIRNKTLKKLKHLSWGDFELLCIELFSKQGWTTLGNEKKGADGGVDIWMVKKFFMKKNVSALVQCKRYDDALVTIKVIREMYGLMHEHEADEVYVVTTSRFTKECYKFIEDKKITLIDGPLLVEMIKKVIS